MFSVQQKREISDAVQKILRDTNHSELPKGEIQFSLNVTGAESWSWANIRNNGAVTLYVYRDDCPAQSSARSTTRIGASEDV